MGDQCRTWIQDGQAQILEQDLINLRSHLAAVRLRTTPIQTLPNELLSDIIRSACTTIGKPPPHTPINSAMLLLIPPPTSKFSETPKYSASVATEVSTVCKRWRLLILSDLVLWSDIDIFQRNPAQPNLLNTFRNAVKWATAFSTHSNPLPVSVAISNYTKNPTAIVNLANFINTHGGRIRELKAYLRVTGDPANDFEQLRSPMPNLEVLEIGCSMQWEPGLGVSLPEIFSNDYPRLKHLSIQHFTSIPPRAFTNLVTLVLSYSQGRVAMADFLRLVAGSPRLEELWIKRYLVTLPIGSDLPSPVSLKRLTSITLENCDSHLILSVLRIPTSAKLRIMYPMNYLKRRPRQALTDTFPLDSNLVTPLNGIRSLSYGVDKTTAVLFLKDSEGSKLVHVEQGYDSQGLGFFPGGYYGYGGSPRKRFHDLFALDQAADFLGGLTTLELDLRGLPNHAEGGSRLSFWLAFFECTSLLEVLRASYSYLPEMMDGLNPSNNAARKVLCPSLRTLQLDIRSGAFDLKGDWLLQVVDATRWRGKRGSPFRNVSVYLMSSGRGHDIILPSDAVSAMFSLRDAGVENMSFTDGTTTYKFDKDNFALPKLPQPFWEGLATTTSRRKGHHS